MSNKAAKRRENLKKLIMDFKIGPFKLARLHGVDDYQTWKFYVFNALDFEELGNCILQENHPMAEKDERKLRNARCYLKMGITPKLIGFVDPCKTAHEVWKCLKDLFERKNLLKLEENFHSLRLDECENLQDYFNKIMMAANQLRMKDEMIKMKLFSGLTSDFKPFLMALDMVADKMTYNQIMAKLIEHERVLIQRNWNKCGSQRYLSSRSYNVRRCHNCGSSDHIVRNCLNK